MTAPPFDERLLESARAKASEMLDQVFEKASRADRTPPLFPNGIEVIAFEFEFALTSEAKLVIKAEVRGGRAQ